MHYFISTKLLIEVIQCGWLLGKWEEIGGIWNEMWSILFFHFLENQWFFPLWAWKCESNLLFHLFLRQKIYKFCNFINPPPLISSLFSTGDFYSLLSKLLGEREDVVHVHKYNPTEKADSESDLVAEIANVVQKKDLGRSDARESTEHEERGNAILVRDRIHKFHRLESTLRPAESRAFSLQQPLPGEGTWESEHTGGAFGASWRIKYEMLQFTLAKSEGNKN